MFTDWRQPAVTTGRRRLVAGLGADRAPGTRERDEARQWLPVAGRVRGSGDRRAAAGTTTSTWPASAQPLTTARRRLGARSGRPGRQAPHHRQADGADARAGEDRPPGGLVIDPFAGSGTTGVAASRRPPTWGVEKTAEYAAIATARLAEAAATPELFTPSAEIERLERRERGVRIDLAAGLPPHGRHGKDRNDEVTLTSTRACGPTRLSTGVATDSLHGRR